MGLHFRSVEDLLPEVFGDRYLSGMIGIENRINAQPCVIRIGLQYIFLCDASNAANVDTPLETPPGQFIPGIHPVLDKPTQSRIFGVKIQSGQMDGSSRNIAIKFRTGDDLYTFFAAGSHHFIRTAVGFVVGQRQSMVAQGLAQQYQLLGCKAAIGVVGM